jgi:hypothetical protein
MPEDSRVAFVSTTQVYEPGYFSQYNEELHGWGLTPGRGNSFFSYPQRPDRLWGAHAASHPMSTGDFPWE